MITQDLLALFESGQSFLGFSLTAKHHVAEKNMDVWELSHQKSGAAVAYMNTEDSERCFSLCFRAFPEDDTGVFHIIEHCIAEEFDKYPVAGRDGCRPVNSFFSAFTSRDNLVFPIASRNEQSFQTLVHMYTECVFNASLLQSDSLLRQEGWRYEYEVGSDTLEYSGIVYSETCAAEAFPEFVIGSTRMMAAFPDTI